jgi:hypothetical protein
MRSKILGMAAGRGDSALASLQKAVANLNRQASGVRSADATPHSSKKQSDGTKIVTTKICFFSFAIRSALAAARFDIVSGHRIAVV